MTTACLTIACLGCAVAAFALFGLATDHHHQQRLGRRPTADRKRILRALAWLGIALCLVLAFAAQGVVYGAMLWVGSLSFGAAATFLFLNLAPTGARSPRSPQ